MTNQTEKQQVFIKINSITLEGELSVLTKTQGLVVFAHGAGSSRQSPRNQFVAQTLNREGIATLLFDLLTAEEDLLYQNRFNIDLLTERLIAVYAWLERQPQIKNLHLGFFGASTGAAAALKAAASLGEKIAAVVSRGGRPDLAKDALPRVQSPTLLIVGGNDWEVIKFNKEAIKYIRAKKQLVIVPGATHLFEEPQALEEVTRLAAKWFKKYLKSVK